MQVEQFAVLYALGLVMLFLLRVSYRIIAPYEIGGDGYGNLLQIREIRQEGHRRPESPRYSAIEGQYAYPYFVHWVLSFVPEDSLKIVERYFSGFMDVCFALLFLALVHLNMLTYQGALLALLVFIATPQFMRPDLAHGTGISCRKPGLILTTVSFLAFFQWVQAGEPISFGIAVLSGAAMLMTSRFSLQAYVFVLAPTSVLISLDAILLFVAALVTAVVVSKGRYLRILRVHLRHVHDYAKKKQYKRFDHSISNPISFGLTLIREDTNRERLRLLKNSKRLRPFIDNPYVLPVLVALFLMYDQFGLPESYLIWMLATVAAFTLTALPHLLFLGQASRYLEYGFIPSVVLIATAFDALDTLFMMVLLMSVVAGFAVEVLYIKSYKRFFASPETRRNFESMVEHLDKLENGVVVVQPSYNARGIAWETNHIVVESVGLVGASTKEGIRQLNTLYPSRSGFVTSDLDWLNKTYEPNYVVFDLEKIAEMGIEDGELILPSADPIFANNTFELYNFDQVRQEI